MGSLLKCELTKSCWGEGDFTLRSCVLPSKKNHQHCCAHLYERRKLCNQGFKFVSLLSVLGRQHHMWSTLRRMPAITEYLARCGTAVRAV